MLFEQRAFQGLSLSVALPGELAAALTTFLESALPEEDLTFASWRPSRGDGRFTAVVDELVLPGPGDRLRHGSVEFTGAYVRRALAHLKPEHGLALIHSHPARGWQWMSRDDEVAERDRLAAAATSTGLPLLGLTWATDRAISGRLWLRAAPRKYRPLHARTTRSVGRRLLMTFNPQLEPISAISHALDATVSVWGRATQADLARLRIGIVGLGSVGSLVAEALARSGAAHFTLIDHDVIEERNLDRTAGARRADAPRARSKVDVARRNIRAVHTASRVHVSSHQVSLLSDEGLAAALACDVLFSCVDRPWPRHVLSSLSYAHLIPIIDGGIQAVVAGQRLVHADWRIHIVGPDRACLACIRALDLGDVQLDMSGKLDDPDYIRGLPEHVRERFGRRNVFAFSLAVAGHELLQLVGLISGNQRLAGIGPQTYHCYPGVLTVTPTTTCKDGCDYAALTGTAADLRGNIAPFR